MDVQRVREAESRIEPRLANGPQRVQSKVWIHTLSILQRGDIRQLSGI